MRYRKDKDLDFLQYISSDQLNDLVDCITKRNNGSLRLTEALTISENYNKNYPNHNKYWQDIASEIQLFGANSIISLCRLGKGVLYREILEDVCHRLKVDFNKQSKTNIIEQNLLEKIIADTIENLSEYDKIQLARDVNITNSPLSTGETISKTVLVLFKQGGFRNHQSTLQIVHIIWKALFDKGLTMLSGGVRTKTLSIITGPIGWAVTGLWTLNDIASPAYRVTIPAVIQISLLRYVHNNKIEI